MSNKPDPEEAADAAHEAIDADRLLPGEDPASPLLEDALHWAAVYGELTEAKTSIVDLTQKRIQASLERPVRQELSLDETVMLTELSRLQHRLGFWTARADELRGSSSQDPS